LSGIGITGVEPLDSVTAEVIVVLQSNDRTFIKLFFQPRPSQFFYDMDSPTEEGNQRKKARRNDKQQHKRQPPKFDEGSVALATVGIPLVTHPSQLMSIKGLAGYSETILCSKRGINVKKQKFIGEMETYMYQHYANNAVHFKVQ
jgi:hypothetical protein